MRDALFLDFMQRRMVNTVPTFRDNVTVPSSRVKHSEKNLDHSSPTAWTLKMGLLGCPETSVRNYYSALRKIPEDRRSQISWSFFQTFDSYVLMAHTRNNKDSNTVSCC